MVKMEEKAINQTTKAQVEKDSGVSEDTKTLVTVILLLAAYPIGVVVMYFWMRNWAKWVKSLIALPLIIGFILLILAFLISIFSTLSPSESYRKGVCVSECKGNQACIRLCTTYPPK